MKQHKENGIEVVQVEPMVTPGMLMLGVVGFTCAAVIVALAVMGNVIAIMAVTVVATTALIMIGHRMGTGRCEVQDRGRAMRAGFQDQQWKLDMESRVELLSRVSKAQSEQALGLQRASSAVKHLNGSNGHDTSVEELVMGADFTDGLS
jgi:hypothetical protein